MGKAQNSKDIWTAEKAAQERPNILARVDGVMYMGLVESVDDPDATILANGARWKVGLKTVCGALNSGQNLYLSTGAALPIGMEGRQTRHHRS